jgi:hypothetical protein
MQLLVESAPTLTNDSHQRAPPQALLKDRVLKKATVLTPVFSTGSEVMG